MRALCECLQSRLWTQCLQAQEGTIHALHALSHPVSLRVLQLPMQLLQARRQRGGIRHQQFLSLIHI